MLTVIQCRRRAHVFAAAILMAVFFFHPLNALEEPAALPTASEVELATTKAGEFDYVNTYGGMSYYTSTFAATWHEMETRCQVLGGHLVSITTSAEQEIVAQCSSVRGGADVWIGFTDEHDEGDWRWVDGSPVTDEAWTNDGVTIEPDNANGNEHYAVQRGTGYEVVEHRNTWADLPNDVLNYGVLELPQPDLQPLEITVEPANPTTSDAVRVLVAWHNSGGTAPNETCRAFWLDDAPMGEWCAMDIPGGYLGTQQVWEGQLPAGDHMVAFLADAYDQQVESNETNNYAELYFHVGAPAPTEVETYCLGPNEVQLNWQPADPATVSIYVERKEGIHGEWELMEAVGSGITQWVDDTVTAGVSYYYRLRAWDGDQLSGPSNHTDAIPGILPAAPTNLQAQVVSPVHIRLTWQDNATNELGYLIERKAGEFGTWQKTWPLSAGTTLYDDKLVWPEGEFQYRVRAYNQYGFTNWLTTSSVYTPTDPGNFDAGIFVQHGVTPCNMAAIFIDKGDGNGFTLVENTDSSGYVFLTGLKLQDRIRAVWSPKFWKNCRNYNDDSSYPMGIRLWLDSDTGPNTQGTYTPFQIISVQTAYNLQVKHPTFTYDLAISIGKNLAANDPYWNQLYQACQNASDYLYDVSDGQMAFRRFLIYDDYRKWDGADVHLEQGNFTAKAPTDQYDDCDKHSKQEFIKIDGANSTSIHTSGWHRTLVHEFGHYALNFKDEYETGWGSTETMTWLQINVSGKYPGNYGFMDSQGSNAETSSKNDYLKDYDYNCNPSPFPTFPDPCGAVVTEQLYARGKSCWDQLEGKLEGMTSLVNIIKPPHGWYEGRSAANTDRSGPAAWWDDVEGQYINGIPDPSSMKDYPSIEFKTIDTGGPNTAVTTDMIVLDGDKPAAKARVYRLGSRGLECLGSTNDDGRLRASFEPGDELRSYARRPDGTVRDVVSTSEMTKAAQTVAFSASRTTERHWGKADEIDLVAPGAVADVMPRGTLEAPELTLRIWPDEALAAEPFVVAFHGAHVDTIPAYWNPDDDRYESELILDVEDPVFDGTGVFEVGLMDTASNLSFFTVEFWVEEVRAGEFAEITYGTAVLNIPGPRVTEDQATVGSWCNSVPARNPLGLIPVSDIFGAHLAVNDDFSWESGVNIIYGDSLLIGIDETSLGLYSWNGDLQSWVLADSSGVSTQDNVVSAMVTKGGAYAVFATSISDDDTHPGAIEDFGIVDELGTGAVRLFWTASGDDGSSGTAQQYIVAFSEEPFGPESWYELPKITLAMDPGLAGTAETAVVHLPQPGRLYYMAIRSKDDASLMSPVSNVAYVVTEIADANYLPGPPTDMRAVDGPFDTGEAVLLTWQFSNDDGGGKNTIESYQVYRAETDAAAPELIATLPAGVDAWGDETGELGKTYIYYVSAVDSTGETMSEGNRAFSAVNAGVPPVDFTSDGVVGLDDWGHLVDHFGLAQSDAEYDLLFDMDENTEIYETDVEFFSEHYTEGGLPSFDPPGQNGEAVVLFDLKYHEGNIWRVEVLVEGAVNLAGFSFKVLHAPGAELIAVGPGDGTSGLGFLDNQQGTTPTFMGTLRPEAWWFADAIQRPSEYSAPEGGGVLAFMEIYSEVSPELSVDEIILMDHEKHLNFVATAVSVEHNLPTRAYLEQNFPNPFNPQTVFRFATTQRGMVSLRIYDTRGRLVRTVVNEILGPGRHEYTWDGRDGRDGSVASGVYFYRLESPGFEESRKLVLLR